MDKLFGYFGAPNGETKRLQSLHKVITEASAHAKSHPDTVYYIMEPILTIRRVDGQVLIEEIAEVE